MTCYLDMLSIMTYVILLLDAILIDLSYIDPYPEIMTWYLVSFRGYYRLLMFNLFIPCYLEGMICYYLMLA